MTLSSLPALLALLFLAATIPLIPRVSGRQVLLAVCNVGLLYTLIPNRQSWTALILFIASGYVTALALRRWPRGWILSAYICALTAAFLIIRKYDFVMAWLPPSLAGHAIVVVGLSYMLFRQIHFLVDVTQGQIEQLSMWTYANYQINLFTLLSGPIQRYEDFSSQWRALTPGHADSASLQLAFLRMMIGYMKLAVIAPIFLDLYQSSLVSFTAGAHLTAGRHITAFASVFYTFPAYLYLNFSGYCDVVIAAATFVGLKLPENFDKPYLSRNVIDFWTRFHRTLGFWIRDYLFLPLYKGVAERWPARADSLAFLCYFIAFFLAGVWHGPTANFIVYGLLQAVGVSATKLWERHLIKGGGRPKLRQYMQSTRIRILATIATLHFECFSLLFFPNDLTTALLILHPHRT